MKNTITIDRDDTLQFDITDKDGNLTGDYLEFNLNDVSLPLRYRDLVFKDRENRNNYRKDLMIIKKRQDVRTDGDPLSKNELDAFKLGDEYLKKEVEIYNMFLGENGVQKLLCGKPLGWDTFDKIDALINNIIKPQLEENAKSMEDIIKGKYKETKDEAELL
jgi:hypothetical protein